MTSTVELLAFGLAVVAAIRSTWSPCGISMLSTLTPFGERSRGHRYGVTAGWFVAGATLGGALLGSAVAVAAVAVDALSPSGTAVRLVALAVAVITIASDLDIAGLHLPRIPRQVDENWTGRYRRWVYALGFGAQIGVGVSTYVMTSAVYLTAALAALTGNPLVALLVGVSFGLVRGLAILLGARLTTPEAIRVFHRRFEAARPAALAVAVLAQVDVAAILLAGWLHLPAVAAVLVVDAPVAVIVALQRLAPARIPRGRSA